MAINIPVNSGGVFLTAGSSTTGSFGGLIALGTGSILPATGITGSQIVALKYINGYTVVNPGTSYTSYPLAETTISTNFSLVPGTKLELMITSCSLAAGSAPVFLYN
jgi:hypothetical protein